MNTPCWSVGIHPQNIKEMKELIKWVERRGNLASFECEIRLLRRKQPSFYLKLEDY